MLESGKQTSEKIKQEAAKATGTKKKKKRKRKRKRENDVNARNIGGFIFELA